MPASCANALRPTTALLGGGKTPVRCDSNWLVRKISRVLTLVRNETDRGRTRPAITTSSSEALPARSPMPFTVHSTCVAPAASARHALPHGAEHRAVLDGQRVAHRVRQVDRGGAFCDRRPDHPAEKVELGSARVFRRKLDVVGEAPGAPDRDARALQALVAVDPQLVLEVDVRRRDEHVDARPRRGRERLSRQVDVAVVTARQRRECGAAHLLRHGAHAAEVPVRRRGEPRLDHVHSERVQLAREAELLLRGHRVARGLLSVAQRGVEDPHDVLFHGGSSWVKQSAANLWDPRRWLDSDDYSIAYSIATLARAADPS